MSAIQYPATNRGATEARLTLVMQEQSIEKYGEEAKLSSGYRFGDMDKRIERSLIWGIAQNVIVVVDLEIR